MVERSDLILYSKKEKLKNQQKRLSEKIKKMKKNKKKKIKKQHTSSAAAVATK